MRASRIVCFALAGVVGSFVSAHAALLGVAPGFPALAYDNSGVMTYDSATDLFIVDAFPLAIRFTPIAQPVLVVPTGNPAMERVFIQIHVDESGAFSGGVAVADLVVIGQVDQNGDSIPEFSGVLLTGEAVAFGFQETSGATGIFDFRFAVTGGAMASEFGGGAIGVTLASENSNFPGDFTRSFAGFAKGNIGPIAFRCGDDFVDGGEQCDDGANNSDTAPNACRTDCTRAGCGDGVVDAGEQCDDGAGNSDTEPNACRIDCTRPSCGDGVVDAGEQCDDGTNNSDTAPNACRTDCTRAACGDGVIDAGEQCDDGNTNDNDACSNNCTTGCGNGIVNTGEQCDGASDKACPGECDNSCKCIPTCELNVVKTCEVPAPTYVCTKPIQSLTMKWNGSESIRIAGTAGVTPFDIDNIAVGGVVTVSGYNGSTNDVIWNIYKAGAGGAVLGRSDFHLSCSDSDMNDPTDCGKAEGDAKGLLGFINTWIFGGMAGSGATLVCPGIDSGTAGATTCAIVVPPYVCTKPIVSLTMEWNGTEPIRIAGTAGVTPFDIDNIAVGGVVTVSGYNGSPNDVIWNIYKAGTSTVLGRSDFHLSCSDSDMNGPEDCDKAEGDAKGLLGFINTWIFNGMSGGGKTLDCNNPGGGSTSPVTYRYVVTNKTSNPVTGVNLTDEITDSSGTFTVPIAGPFDLAPNETKNFSSVDDIGTDTTDVATASNDICSASSEIVTVTGGGGPGPVPGCATGADALVLRGKEVSWLLTNSTASRLQISKITISWPGANGFLDQVKLHKDKISDGNFNPPTVEITRFKGKKGDRTIDKNKAEALRFVFQNAAASGPYTIKVEFSNGCSVSKAIP